MASFRVFWKPEFVLHVGALPWMHFNESLYREKGFTGNLLTHTGFFYCPKICTAAMV